MVDGPPTPPLPPGWTERYTEAGSVYYWNPTSGETSWERPKFRPPVGTATVNPVHRGAPPTAPTAKNYEVKIAPRAGGWKRKAIIGAVVACAVTVVVVVAVLLMGSSGSSSASGTTTVQPEEGEDIFINGGSTVRMAVSDPGVLYVLEVVDEDGARTPVGRSYDGNAWEATFPFTLVFQDGVISLPSLAAGQRYLARAVRGTATPAQRAARLLIQGTFGPTAESISDAVAIGGEGAWIAQQMAEAPTLHRAHLRHRANPRRGNSNGQVAGLYRACEAHSRWSRYAFRRQDEGSSMNITESGDVFIGGYLRTRLSVEDFNASDPEVAAALGPAPYFICEVDEELGGAVELGPECNQNFLANGPIDFAAAAPPKNVMTESAVLEQLVYPDEDAVRLLATEPAGCEAPNIEPVFLREASTSDWYLFDPRSQFINNTLEHPAEHEATIEHRCPVVRKNFVNAGTCEPGRATCTPVTYVNKPFQLNDTTIPLFYQTAGSYVYYVTGLRLDDEDPPCDTWQAKWLKHAGGCSDAVARGDAGTTNTTYDYITSRLREKILEDEDADGVAVVVDTGTSSLCELAPLGMKINITIPDEAENYTMCFEHVHINLYDVMDFSMWAIRDHPGNDDAFDGQRPNPIKQRALDGSAEIRFPDWHLMSQWNRNRYRHEVIGIFGQTVYFGELPVAAVQTEALAEMLGAVSHPPAEGTEACGSPGEVVNIPYLGAPYHLFTEYSSDVFEYPRDQPMSRNNFRESVWWNVILKSPDQLRQRMAWALSQIFVINSDVDGQVFEMYASYYDIFVRHAFGSFRDVVKEVSYSPAMAIFLTYLDNRSLLFQLNRGRLAYPDENMAREIMQLFTLGLYQLNLDGTRVKGASGAALPTYTNENIFEFAKVWTGFQRANGRGNIENRDGPESRNNLDPMIIRTDRRDPFPKLNLYGGYLGDRYPLCEDFPAKQFLRLGATYRYLGNSFTPELQESVDDDEVHHIVLSDSSRLLAELCNASPSPPGDCNYASEVVLDANLDCFGQECELDTVRVVALEMPGKEPVFFEYVRPPCVNLQFFQGHPVSNRWRSWDIYCANANSHAAQGPCCPENSGRATLACEYTFERVAHATAAARCNASELSICDFWGTYPPFCGSRMRYWSAGTCTVRAQVDSRGKVLAVHTMPDERSSNGRRLEVQEDNMELVTPVSWSAAGYPAAASGCGGVCEVRNETCLCNATRTRQPVFGDFEELQSPAHVLRNLFVGAPNPSSFDASTYERCSSAACTAIDGVAVHLHRTSSGDLDERAIIEVTDPMSRKGVFLYNVAETVLIGDGRFEFRNPVTFHELFEVTARDSHNEMDALFDHLVYHNTTAPFVAKFLIQKFTTSNPSPRYTEAVATAFRAGRYETFGSGEYGDLSATVAAILLDREARSPVLELDTSHGMLREPVLKLAHVMRAFEFETVENNTYEVELDSLTDKLGQEPWHAPSVFGFFLPDFEPPGRIGQAGLVSPEAQALTGPNVVNYMNGMAALFLYGLSNCDNGFGAGRRGSQCWRVRLGRNDPSEAWYGHLTWSPSSSNVTEIIAAIDLLLTGGRMHPATRATLALAYSNRFNETGDAAHALSVAQTLASFTGEFSSSSVPRLTDEAVEVGNTEVSDTSTGDYKALVYLFLGGGLDSFNLIVPHSGCTGGLSFDMYNSVRTDVALVQETLLQISVPQGEQPCTTFGIHPSLPILKELYDDGDAAFVANIGTLVEPLTKEEYQSGTKEAPPSLFAHNKQQEQTQTVHAQSSFSQGVIGRCADALYRQGTESVASYSISGNAKVLQPERGFSPEPDTLNSYEGATPFDEYGAFPYFRPYIGNLTQNRSASIFADTWSSTVANSIASSDVLNAAIDNATLAVLEDVNPASNLERELFMAARLVRQRNILKSSRNGFFTSIGGFDTHSDNGPRLVSLFSNINSALTHFVNEMKAQGLWDDVTIVVASEFARTITSNGLGTDHGWGGNMVVIGGGVRGGTIRGHFPEDLTDEGPLNIGRGRVIPTTSWEALWQGIASWWGVSEGEMDRVLPNRRNFPASELFTREQLFVN